MGAHMDVTVNRGMVSFTDLSIKTIVVHTATYFIMGLLAMQFLDYAHQFAQPGLQTYMRPLSDPLVAAGPLFQPIRGLLFAIAFYPLREILFFRKKGWAVMWLLLVTLGILSTFGPSPGSIEGVIYTSRPLQLQVFGLPEVILQSLFLSAILCYWITHPQNKRLAFSMWILFAAALAASILGIVLRPA